MEPLRGVFFQLFFQWGFFQWLLHPCPLGLLYVDECFLGGNILREIFPVFSRGDVVSNSLPVLQKNKSDLKQKQIEFIVEALDLSGGRSTSFGIKNTFY